MTGRQRRPPASAWLRILWRGLRWRLAAGVLLFAVAVVAIAGAAIGPIYLRAADDSTITSQLKQALLGSTNVSMTATGGAGALARVTATARGAERLNGGSWFTSPVVSVDSVVDTTHAGVLYSADLLARSNVCAHVVIRSGRCPTADGDVAMSVRSAALAGLHLGQTVELQRPGVARSTTRAARLVGLYEPPALGTTYWNNENYFHFQVPPHPPIRLDALLASATTALAIQSIGLVPQETGFVSLRPGSIRAGDIGRVDAAIQSYTALAGRTRHVQVASTLPSVLATATAGERTLRSIVEAIALQLVFLALLVLYGLIKASSNERRRDTAIARRRGFTRGALLMVAAGEPLVLVAAALPVGLVVAWIAVVIAGRGQFESGTPVTVTWPAVLAALAGVAAGVLAAVAASWELWRGTDRAAEASARNRAAVAALDALGIALGAAGLVELAVPRSLGVGSGNPVAMLAPLFAALGLGLIAVRLAALVLRGALHASRHTRHVAWFLAVRELARRRPFRLRQLLPLTAAIVLVVLAVDEWAVANANRSSVASTQVGAGQVVDVRVAPGVDLAAAVDRADPSGRQAMAAAIDRSNNGNLLAVQSSRLAAVASWPPGLSSEPVAAVGRYLTPRVVPPLAFTGLRLRVVAAVSAHAPPTDLGATVFNEQSQSEQTVSLGLLHSRPRALTASLRTACVTTCRLVDLSPISVGRLRQLHGRVTVTLTGISVQSENAQSWQSLPVRGTTPHSWTAQPSSASISESGGVIEFTAPAGDLGSQGTAFSPADIPSLVPAVVTTRLAQASVPTIATNSVLVPGLDGNALSAAADIEVSALPEIGANAAMVDLGFAQLAQTTQANATAVDQVWLRPGADAVILHRLRRDGVVPTGVRSSAARLATADRGPAALGYTLVLYDAVAALMLALGVAGAVLASSSRRRRREARHLSIAGIPRPAIGRSVWYETAVVFGTTFAIGAAVGVTVSRLAVNSLPQFTTSTGGIPLSHSLPLPVVLSVLAVVLLLLVAVTMLTGSAADRDRSAAASLTRGRAL